MLTINNTLDGYLKDVEIKGNTIQDTSNLADIKSVGEKVEGQELYEIPVLSRGKNLCNQSFEVGGITVSTGELNTEITKCRTTNFIILNPGTYIGVIDNNKSNRCDAFLYNYDTKTFIERKTEINKYPFTINSTTLVRILRPDSSTIPTTFQLEEGTVATPYEPYQEDKITILSPCQIEKVGDVADRIICKDGVWGVEKNVVTIVLNGSESWNFMAYADLENTIGFVHNRSNNIPLITPNIVNYMNNKFVSLPNSNWDQDIECFIIMNNANIGLKISKSKLSTQDVQGIKQWLQDNNVLVKYQTTQPQFIPLPHSQQVKLRTFANKTNISFGCEIEGTIKAQVPKSFGATVNTHTEQISNLNKELDRVKKLEESTVSTVTTESDFTTVEATSNGYFEDVKLEGKTLVNLNNFKKSNSLSDRIRWESNDVKNIQGGVTVWNLSDKPISIDVHHLDTDTYKAWYIVSSNSCKVISIGDNEKVGAVIGLFVNGWTSSELDKLKKSVIILEGDHAQNPPSYFEGLKSVGQSTSEDGADEIVVSSVNENLVEFDSVFTSGVASWGSANLSNGASHNVSLNSNLCKVTIANNSQYHFLVFKTTIRKGVSYSYKFDSTSTLGNSVSLFKDLSVTRGQIVGGDFSGTFVANDDYNYIALPINREVNTYSVSNFILTKDTQVTEYTPHQSDKKRLLFYNEETQTWEKPVLREWDSIEKHADGKYYYHQRSGEVVLNGSENWTSVADNNKELTKLFRLNDIKNVKALDNPISDVFIGENVYAIDEEGCYCSDNGFRIRILNTKLSSQDVEGFKQWLQTNNVTVVYQLAQEKVYECTNIDLITYANETNYIVESGAIVPRSTLKVHNNISNVVSLLQKKVSLLESNITNYMITQNRMQLASTYSADSVTFKVDYALCSEEVEYNEDLYNLILNNILVGKDNYDYDKMFTMILDYASWNQISWEQFDILVGLMDMQHNPPIEEIPTDDEVIEETPNEIM